MLPLQPHSLTSLSLCSLIDSECIIPEPLQQRVRLIIKNQRLIIKNQAQEVLAKVNSINCDDDVSAELEKCSIAIKVQMLSMNDNSFPYIIRTFSTLLQQAKRLETRTSVLV